MDLPALLLFAGVYALAVSTPGPGLAAVVARGLGQGLAAGPAFVAGFVVGDLIWLTIAATGMAVIAHSLESLFQVIKYAGCAYLLWMAWKIWSSPAKPADVVATTGKVASWPSFLGSLALTLGNPKVVVFFLSIMPLVIDIKAITPLAFAELAVIVVLVITPVMTAALVLADRARRVFTSERALRRINRGTAVVMAGAAVVIATRN
jgi:threonine/homoserine/homoserine lactone efflux protein